MVRAVGDRLEVVFRVVALVEDQGDVFGTAVDLAVACDERVGQAGESGGIGLVSRVGMMQQRQVEVGGDEESEADDPQRLFLAVAALGQRAALVEGVDEGEEVGGVEQDAPEVDVEVAHQAGDDVALDPGDGVERDPVHVVPEPLARELVRLDADQAIKNGVLEPLCGAGLRAGSDATVEDSDQQVGADGRSVALLGNVPVYMVGEAQASGETVKGGDGAEVAHQGFDGIAGHDGDDLVGRTEILLPDDGGLSVDALGLTRVVVRLSADVFFDEADHSSDLLFGDVRSYIVQNMV